MSEDSTTTNVTRNYNEWAERAVRIVAKNAMVGTHHRMVDTPHILLGVLKEGPAANLLNRSFGITFQNVLVIVQKMPKPLPAGLGADFLYTDDAYSVLDRARELADEYGFRHGQVYTEHLLMALLYVNDASFMHVMTALGVDRDELVREVTKGLEWKVELASR